MVPAIPPDKMLLVNFFTCGASFGVLNAALILSLKAKFKAWVGKYRMQFAKFPRQNDMTPSLASVRLEHSTIPPYALSSLPYNRNIWLKLRR